MEVEIYGNQNIGICNKFNEMNFRTNAIGLQMGPIMGPRNSAASRPHLLYWMIIIYRTEKRRQNRNRALTLLWRWARKWPKVADWWREAMGSFPTSCSDPIKTINNIAPRQQKRRPSRLSSTTTHDFKFSPSLEKANCSIDRLRGASYKCCICQPRGGSPLLQQMAVISKSALILI